MESSSFRHDTHDGIGCFDDRHCALDLDLVRQPELSLDRLDHTQHAEVQKALSCDQLPTLDGSWRKLSAFGIFISFFRS